MQPYRILVLGDHEIGKSSLINSFSHFYKSHVRVQSNISIHTFSSVLGSSTPVEVYDSNSKLKTSKNVSNFTSLKRRITFKKVERSADKISRKKSTKLQKPPPTSSKLKRFDSFADLEPGVLEPGVHYDAYLLCYSTHNTNSFKNVEHRWFFEIGRLSSLQRQCVILCGISNFDGMTVAVPTQTGIELSEKLITQNFIEYKIGCNENIFEEIVQTLVRFKSSATLTGVKNTELHDSLFTDRRYDQGCYSKLRRFKWYLQRAIGNPLKKRSETSDLRNK